MYRKCKFPTWLLGWLIIKKAIKEPKVKYKQNTFIQYSSRIHPRGLPQIKEIKRLVTHLGSNLHKIHIPYSYKEI